VPVIAERLSGLQRKQDYSMLSRSKQFSPLRQWQIGPFEAWRLDGMA
jgi:hypothetical protein